MKIIIKPKGINVLSLFDGISCGMLALRRADILIKNYFASEINKKAIQISKKNYPSIKHIGDVLKITQDKLPKIGLLMGGSPCQGFSFAGNQLAFDDRRSKLFFEFVRLKKEKWFPRLRWKVFTLVRHPMSRIWQIGQRIELLEEYL